MAGRRRSVRVRLTTTALAVVAVALAFGGVGLVTILRANLERGVADAAALRAADVAALVANGSLPSSIVFPGEERSVIQVIDASGVVVSSTSNIAGEPALAVRPSSRYTIVDVPVGDGQRFALTAKTAQGSSGPMTILSGESLERVDATRRAVTYALAGGLPALLGVVAALAWVGAGRALRPVEAIRAEVAEITESDLHRRVPDPASRDEIGELASTMNAMLDRLEEASVRQARFVADASHELRSPLTSLRAQLEIGLARPNRLDWPERVRGALADVERLEVLTRDLLTLERSAREHVSRDRIDLGLLVRTEVERTVRCDGIDIHLDVDIDVDHPGPVIGDRSELERVVANLLSNALRHARSQVVVSVASDSDQATLDVTDDGPGIGPADRDRIFERFVRLDDARDAADGGSGLGLAIVKGIVNAHGGSITIIDVGAGACFRVVLPAAASGDR